MAGSLNEAWMAEFSDHGLFCNYLYIYIIEIMVDTFEREMTITHADFFRLLPKALADYQYRISGTSIHIKIRTGSITIHLTPESARRIGNLELPVTHLSFRFKNISGDQLQEFFNRFDRAYQKGGG